MHLLFQCGEKPYWLKLRQTVHDFCYAVIPGRVAMDVGAITKGQGKGKSKHKYDESHGDGGKERKARKANRRRIRKSPRVTSIWTVIVCFVEYGDTSRKTVGFEKERDTKSTMFLKMDKQHHAQHQWTSSSSAHFSRRHRRTVRSSTAALRRTKTAGYSEWKVKKVRSRIILLVQMNFLTMAEMARE